MSSGFNDVENTTLSKIRVESNLSVGQTDIIESLINGISYANANVDTFDITNTLITTADMDNISVDHTLNDLVVENNLRVTGVGVTSFLDTNTNGQVYDTSVSHDPSTGNFQGSLYVSSEVYINMDIIDTNYSGNYVRLSIVLFAIKGVLESILGISTVKKSLHRLSYNVDFELDAGIRVEVEDFVPDITISGPTLTLDTDVSVLISDNTNDKITPFISRSNFQISSDSVIVERNSDQVSGYNWLVEDSNGISTNTLLKGLFGELLAESPFIVTTRDQDNNDIVSNASILLNVFEPERHSANFGNTVWTEIYYKLEHEAMMEELSSSFLNVWGDSDNLDWYVYFFNAKRTGTLFHDGDVFQVPIDITMQFQLKTLGALDNLNGNEKLTPMSFQSNSVNTAEIPKIQKTFRLLYKFNVQQSPNSILASGNFSTSGIRVDEVVYAYVYYQMPNGLFALIPSITTPPPTTSAIAICTYSVTMKLPSEETNSSTTLEFFEQFYQNPSDLYTLVELQSQTHVLIEQDLVLSNQVIDLSYYFSYLLTTNFAETYVRAADNNYKLVTSTTNTADAEVSTSLAVFDDRLFHYTSQNVLEEISYATGDVLGSNIDMNSAVIFTEPTGINIPV